MTSSLAASENIRELRDTPASKLYDVTKSCSAEPWGPIFAGIDMLPEVKAAVIDEWHRVAADSGATQNDVELMITEARTSTKAPPTAEQRTQMRSEAGRQLVSFYGEDAGKALAGALRLVARDPRLAAMLDRTGLGNSPKVVMRLTELASFQQSRGRLK